MIFEETPLDVSIYTDYCVSRTLYDFLIGKLTERGIVVEDKSDFKARVLFYTLYGFNHSNQPLWEILAETFPSVAKYISKAKERGQLYKPVWRMPTKTDKDRSRRKDGKVKVLKDISNALLPRQMQSVEAQFIIQGCCQALRDKRPGMPILSLHDSIYCCYGDGAKVKKIMLKQFQSRYDIRPTLTIEKV